MADMGMPGNWLEATIRKLLEQGGFDFEDLRQLVSQRDLMMEKLVESWGTATSGAAISLPPFVARSREDVLELICLLTEHYQYPVILGDALGLAVRLTAQAAPLGDERIKQALSEWFCLIEEDENLGDNDLVPKLVFNECRKALF